MKRFLVLGGALAAATAFFVASAVPAFSADSGTVNARVTVSGAACITVNPTTMVDFGSRAFGSTVADGSISFANCGAQAESVLARGTDATSGAPGSSAAWSLRDGAPGCSGPSPAGPNVYAVGLNDPDPIRAKWLVGGGGYLSTSNQYLKDGGSNVSFAAGANAPVATVLYLPCSGSSGAGETMSFQIIFTATV